MSNIKVESCVKEYAVCNGVLRFDCSSKKLREQFYAVKEKIQQIEKDYVAAVATTKISLSMICLVRETDNKIKGLLCEVFGKENDIETIFRGAVFMAKGHNGERMIVNLLHDLDAIFEETDKLSEMAVDGTASDTPAAEGKNVAENTGNKK